MSAPSRPPLVPLPLVAAAAILARHGIEPILQFTVRDRNRLAIQADYIGAPALGMARQALHAARLGFEHPASGTALRFEAGLPADLQAAWQAVASATALPLESR